MGYGATTSSEHERATTPYEGVRALTTSTEAEATTYSKAETDPTSYAAVEAKTRSRGAAVRTCSTAAAEPIPVMADPVLTHAHESRQQRAVSNDLNPPASNADQTSMSSRQVIRVVLLAIAVAAVGCGYFRSDPDAAERDRLQVEAERFLAELELPNGFTKGKIQTRPATTPKEYQGPNSGLVLLPFSSPPGMTTSEARDRLVPFLAENGLRSVSNWRLLPSECSDDHLSLSWHSTEVRLGGRTIFDRGLGSGSIVFATTHEGYGLEDMTGDAVLDPVVLCPGDDDAS